MERSDGFMIRNLLLARRLLSSSRRQPKKRWTNRLAANDLMALVFFLAWAPSRTFHSFRLPSPLLRTEKGFGSNRRAHSGLAGSRRIREELHAVQDVSEESRERLAHFRPHVLMLIQRSTEKASRPVECYKHYLHLFIRVRLELVTDHDLG